MHDSTSWNAQKLTYACSSSFSDECQSQNLSTVMDASCDKHNNPAAVILLVYRIVVDREAIWALSAPIFSQLESITIPYSDIRRYVEPVACLEKLERIHIILDLSFDNCYRCGYGQSGGKNKGRTVLMGMVKKHTENFPGRLKNVTRSLSRTERAYVKITPAPFNDSELFRILPPASGTRFIIFENWWRISARLEETDLSLVHEFDWFPPFIDPQRVLQRCRFLKSISYFKPRCFDWAVEEKKALQNYRLGQNSVDHSPDSHKNPDLANRQDRGQVQDQIISSSSSPLSPLLMNSPPQPPRPAYLTHGLVPLEKIHLAVCNIPMLELDAAAFAFNRSLKYLKIKNFYRLDHIYTPIHLGHGWVDLPVLERLELNVSNTHLYPNMPKALILDPLLLSKCPALVYVKVVDHTLQYKCDEIVPWKPAYLPRITSLYLKGWSALTFNPETLASTKKLEFLKLTMRRPGYCYIPPFNKLREAYGLAENRGGDITSQLSATLSTRPRWTWDWYLPALTYLHLTSEFAYLFEFRMLNGCPALETLRLQMRTETVERLRLISESTLFISGAEGSQERIVAPRLRRLYMIGHWVIADPMVVLPQFLSVAMFPRLEHVVARGWVGVTVAAFVKAVRVRATATATLGGGHLKMVRMDGEEPLMVGVRVALGMSRRSADNRKDRHVLSTRLFYGGKEYVLHRE
ncbi:hypothetical protein BGZ96_008866 [Linnemannia gamsii]|uniref:Uncharacterized protein n=1 Tax=Linnemannia gamsii TaxID=64522 RepID=A0ABQ7JXM0_9FUNG|nr:hypothetical protein BGZ96_008866 [Linnemannia gamsii]